MDTKKVLEFIKNIKQIERNYKTSGGSFTNEMLKEFIKEACEKFCQVDAGVVLRIAEIANTALEQWKLHIEENEQENIRDIWHLEATIWKELKAELQTLKSNLST